MEQITACFIGTTMRHREAIAKEALHALDSCFDSRLVTNKIASIDIFGYANLGNIADFAIHKGWSVINKPLRPAMESQYDLIEAAYNLPGNWILYCEDDVIVKKLPQLKEFEQIVNFEFNGRKPGMISLMHGGFSRGEETKQAHADWLSNQANWKWYYSPESDMRCILHRSDELRDAHFFEFPVTIVRKDIFLSCNLWAQKNRKGVHSETALTDAWFALGYDKTYCKVSWLKWCEKLEYTFEDYDNYILQNKLWVEAFGNSERLRRVPVTGGISMSF